MLPVRLEIRNFLAYRAPAPLSFEGLSLACLSGPNGAGKSSLLDAMTWALWGRARAKTDDELIHMGQDEMSVQFDFRQDHTEYRVIRKRSKKGRGQSTLDFFVRDEQTGQFNQITESSIREMQARIIQLLRLDYETFIHSAFLQQGKADAFTVATPSRRKDILAEILGLARWQEYEKQAKDILKQMDDDLLTYSVLIQDIEREEVDEPRLRGELATAIVQVDEARQAREFAEEALAEVAGAEGTMKATQATYASVQRQIRNHEQDIAAQEAELVQQQQRLASYQKMIADREDIEQGYAQLESTRQAYDEMGEKLEQQDSLKDRLNELMHQLAAERAELESQANVYESRIYEAELVINSADTLEAELADVNVELDRLLKQKTERDEIQAARQAVLQEDTERRTRNLSLKTEMDAIKDRLKMVEQADGAACPVCGQALDANHVAELTEQYQTEGKSRGDEWRSNEARMKAIKQEVSSFDSTLKHIEIDLRGFDTLTAKAGALQERWTSIKDKEAQLENDRGLLNEVRQTLTEENYSLELRGQINELQSQIESLGFDREAYSEAREALRTLKAFEGQMRELEVAVQSLPDVQTRLDDLGSRLDRSRVELTTVCEEAIALQKEIDALTATVKEAQRRQAEVNRLKALERSATETLISIQQRLSAIDAARKRKVELGAQRDAIAEDYTIYEQLREAFGKNGIPAMIIEAAIPELEEATNRLLTRMTDGRINVRFDTQRVNKSNDNVRETLDIMVSDELGTRNYEMFSGGEGFRVNFALRIALSQFLARRAGARLQTLVIDEGFGSQDDMGRERLVEAISAIRNDFDLILIVTHIDDLRDAFPVHIEVRKTRDGAMIQIV